MKAYCPYFNLWLAKHSTSVIEWNGYTLLSLKQVLSVLEHKTKYFCLLVKILFIFSKVHSSMFIQLHKCQCYSSYK